MEVKEIKATEGYYLTQVDEVGEDRVFLTAIKGVNVNAFDWKEVSASEKEAWDKAREEALKELEKAEIQK